MGEVNTIEKGTGIPDIETMSQAELIIENNRLSQAITDEMARIEAATDPVLKKGFEENLELLKERKRQIEAKLS